MEIIIKRYEHYNRSLGKYISSKRQYFDELKRGGYVPFEEGQRLAESKEKESKWIPSKDLIEMNKYILSHGDKNGNIVVAKHEGIMKALDKKKIKFAMPQDLPKDKGGFNAS